MVDTRWGPWNPETGACPECGDGDNLPPSGGYHCGTCDAEWPDESEEDFDQ